MGHMDQVWKGTCSTQPRTPTNHTIPTSALPHMPNLHIDNYMVDIPQEPHNACTHIIFMHTHAINSTTSSNQTGRFLITSNWGNAYVVVFYVVDPNYIRLVPIKNRSKEELLRAYRETYEWLTMRGFKNLLHKMDNETSHKVENFIRSQQTHLQYTPPDIHRTNPAERTICTWKNHFLADIAGLPKSFPIANWCRLTALFVTNIDALFSKYFTPPVGLVKGKTSKETFLTIPQSRWVCHISGKD